MAGETATQPGGNHSPAAACTAPANRPGQISRPGRTPNAIQGRHPGPQSTRPPRTTRSAICRLVPNPSFLWTADTAFSAVNPNHRTHNSTLAACRSSSGLVRSAPGRTPETCRTQCVTRGTRDSPGPPADELRPLAACASRRLAQPRRTFVTGVPQVRPPVY